jgi:hypothetical protein
VNQIVDSGSVAVDPYMLLAFNKMKQLLDATIPLWYQGITMKNNELPGELNDDNFNPNFYELSPLDESDDIDF